MTGPDYRRIVRDLMAGRSRSLSVELLPGHRVSLTDIIRQDWEPGLNVPAQAVQLAAARWARSMGMRLRHVAPNGHRLDSDGCTIDHYELRCDRAGTVGPCATWPVAVNASQRDHLHRLARLAWLAREQRTQVRDTVRLAATMAEQLAPEVSGFQAEGRCIDRHIAGAAVACGLVHRWSVVDTDGPWWVPIPEAEQ